MSQHVPNDLLTAFVEGDVGEQLAVHIAEHLDECPGCLNVAAGMEPLNAAFAAMDDPEVPADLVARVLAQADAPESLPLTELGISAVLLSTAGLVAVLFGKPVAMATDLGLVLAALGDGLRVVAIGLTGSGPALALTALACFGMFFTARFALPDMAELSGQRRIL